MQRPGEDEMQAILDGSLKNHHFTVFRPDEFSEASEKLAMGGFHPGEEADGRQFW